MKPKERTQFDEALAQLRQRQRQSKSVSVPTSYYSGYHMAAAVLTSYDSRLLHPFGDVDRRAEALDHLLADSIHITAGDSGMWQLRDDVRRDALLEMGDVETLKEALEANWPRPTDYTQTLFEAFLMETAPSIEELDRPQLAAARRVIDWLEGIVDGLPSRESINQRFAQLDLFSPFEHLVGDHFRGREKELNRLRWFISLGNLAIVDNKVEPLMLHGPGGMGKSTLFAKFILEIANLEGPAHIPWSYLDLDRAGLRPEQPLTLLIESLRQLGVQYPESQARCDRIRQDWQRSLTQRSHRRSTGQKADIGGGAPIDRFVWVKELHNYVALVRSLTTESAPLLLMVDTFEEAQYRSPLVVDNLLEFIHKLQSLLPSACIIFSGRAGLTEAQMDGMDDMRLGSFDDLAALGYLEGRGVPTEAAQFIIIRVGRSPLSLRLAAELWQQRSDLDDVAVFGGDIAVELESGEIQGILYRRILGHIHDEDVRQIAYPGLILRRITPEIIREVLAEPSGLGEIDQAKSDQLYEELRREAALAIDEGDALRCQPDLRRSILPLLRSREGPLVQRIESAAVEYYAQKKGPEARAEEIYHRLSLKQPLTHLDAAWGDGTGIAVRTLYSAVDELEPKQRAWLVDKLPGRSLTDEESVEARLSEWEDDTAVKVQQLLSTKQLRDAKKGLELLGQRRKRQANSELYALEAEALYALNDYEGAQEVLQKGLRAASRWRHYTLAVNLRIMQARLAREAGDVEKAERTLVKADRQVRMVEGSRLQLIEIGLQRLALPIESDAALPIELSEWFGELDDNDVIANADLMGQLAGAIGVAYPSVLWRVIDLTGIDSDHRDLLHALGRAIASWDEDYSADVQMAPGVLLRRFKIPEAGPLATSWAAYLLDAGSSERVSLIRNLRTISDRLPRPVRAALAALMAGRAQPLAAAEPTPVEETGARVEMSNEQTRRLIQALVNAFDYSGLSRILRYRLDINLEAISGSKMFIDVVFEVVTSAERGGWLADLLVAVREARPDSADLAVIASEILVERDKSQESLEKVIDSNASVSPAEFATQLARHDTRICRLEIGTQTYATGILVGPDLVLTVYHALDQVIEGEVPVDEVRLRFDYKISPDGVSVYPGSVFGLADEWLVAPSPTSRSDSDPLELDFALLRLDGNPGETPLGMGDFESTAEVRGWVHVSAAPVALRPDDSLLILHHPMGGPLRMTFGRFSAYNQNRTQLYYEADTEAGSAGAAIFDANWTLVGLHHARLPVEQTAEGIPIEAIMNWLEAHGQRHLIDSSVRRTESTGAMQTSEKMAGRVNGQQIEVSREKLAVARLEENVDDEITQLIELGRESQAVGHFERAADRYRKALALAREEGDAASVVYALSFQAVLLQELGESRQASALMQESYQIAESSGDMRLEAVILNDLGILQQAQGNYAAARDYYERAVSMSESELGPDHLDTARSHENLGALMFELEEYDEARLHYEQALATYEKVLGPDHPDTADGLNRLGMLYQTQGDLEGARKRFERALAINERALGHDDPVTAQSLTTLGQLLQAQGEYAEAQEFYERALAINEKTVGADHPDTAATLNLMGFLYQEQGGFETAQFYVERALGINEKVLGAGHPDTARSHNSLGFLYEEQGEYEAARKQYEEALAIFDQVLGADHRDTIQTRELLENLSFS